MKHARAGLKAQSIPVMRPDVDRIATEMIVVAI